jgi:hypothetical protein
MKNESYVPLPPKPTLSTIPIALYESNGQIFELYQGGQPCRPAVVWWERLKTVTVTVQDRDHEVRIRQRQQKVSLPGE